MKISKLMTLTLAAIVMCGFGITAAQANPFTLADDNATAEINLDTQAGMFSWTTDTIDNLFQQWFWYRIGDTTVAQSIDTLTREFTLLSNTNIDPASDTLFVKYSNATGVGVGDETFTIELSWKLDGGSAGSGASDISEQITITSAGAAISGFHFFQYSDFDLNDELPNDTVRLANPNLWVQTNPNGLQLSETITTPAGDRWEANTFANTRNSLNNVIGYNLNNDGGPLGPDDVTWAWQWDFDLAAGGSFGISKDKRLEIIPAPGAALLAVMGMGMIGRIRRRNA